MKAEAYKACTNMVKMGATHDSRQRFDVVFMEKWPLKKYVNTTSTTSIKKTSAAKANLTQNLFNPSPKFCPIPDCRQPGH